MQETKSRRSNVERTETTRAALLAAGRRLFVEKGYAGTGTPELVAAAGVTRGALYHHFADKSALFQAVVEAESVSVAEAVEKAAPVGLSPLQALTMGGEAFLDAMLVPGRTRLLLVDGPAVLGRAEMDRIDEELGAARTLREGLAAAMRARAIARLPVEPLAAHLAAAFDRAALAIEAGASRSEHGAVLAALIGGLAATR
jgi:AcrR family transcriptional regulator